jgi:HD-GYP domain-containing protein (c-di-GMP phosphodiesterase class II)
MLVQVPVEKLRVGMYVQELDRSWTDTDFAFQGFVIRNDDDIRELQRQCRFVFVSDLKSQLDREGLEVLDRLTHGSGHRHRKLTAATDIEEWYGSDHFQESMRRLKVLMESIDQPIRQVFDEVIQRNQVDRQRITRLSQAIYDALKDNPKLGQWISALQNPDGSIAEHCRNVAILSIAFARHLGCRESLVTLIGEGALLHDIGLVRVPPFVLDRNHALTEQEYRLVRLHPSYAKTCIGGYLHVPDEIVEIIELHHYRLDGSGYPKFRPDRVKDHVFIVAICDMYEAMTSYRVYRTAMSPEEALLEIDRQSGVGLPDYLVQAFISFLGIYPRGNIVTLANGGIGVVVASSPDHRTRPVIRLLRHPSNNDGSATRKNLRPADYFVDLSLYDPRKPSQAGWQITGTMHPSRLGFQLSDLLKSA